MSPYVIQKGDQECRRENYLVNNFFNLISCLGQSSQNLATNLSFLPNLPIYYKEGEN